MKLTCVIPTHGRPDLVARALDSVLAQTRVPDEIVVVDDLDTAATGQLVAKLAEREQGRTAMRYLPIATHAGRPGASRSRNAGVLAAQGDVVGFLDDDDEWLSEFAQATLELLIDGGYDAAMAWMVKRVQEVERDNPTTRTDMTAAGVLSVNPGFTGSTFLITRAAFDAIGGFDEDLAVSNDKDFLYRLLDGGYRVGVVARRLVRRNLDATGRLGSGGAARAVALKKYQAKYDNRLTVADRRALERAILICLRADVPSRTGRAALLAAAVYRTRGADLRALLLRLRLRRAGRRTPA